LRTTLYDGDSVAVREALHLGTPVIATDNGMRPEGVHLIPIHNADALVNAVARIAAATRETRTADNTADERNVEAVWQVYTGLLT
jgi:glycosyltransferase involved in cell wall biosynthesis